MRLNEKIPLLRSKMVPPWSQNDLAIALNVTLSMVKNWEYERNESSRKHTAKLAEVTGVDRDWLEDDSRGEPIQWGKPRSRPERGEVTLVDDANLPRGLRRTLQGDQALLPVWRGIAASAEDECYFVTPDSPEFMEVPAFLVGEDIHSYVLAIVAGHSMAPRLRQGSRAVVRLSELPPPRNTLVVVERPDRQRFIKVLRETPSGFELHPLNDKFEPIKLPVDWKYVGQVIAVMGEYEMGQPNIEYDGGRTLKA